MGHNTCKSIMGRALCVVRRYLVQMCPTWWVFCLKWLREASGEWRKCEHASVWTLNYGCRIRVVWLRVRKTWLRDEKFPGKPPSLNWHPPVMDQSAQGNCPCWPTMLLILVTWYHRWASLWLVGSCELFFTLHFVDISCRKHSLPNAGWQHCNPFIGWRVSCICCHQ